MFSLCLEFGLGLIISYIPASGRGSCRCLQVLLQLLIASFVGTGASFLAFSSMASKHNVKHPDFDYKGFYYLNGLAEGTETVLFFIVMCLLPDHFVTLAWVFAFICAITALNRVWFGYLTIRREENK